MGKRSDDFGSTRDDEEGQAKATIEGHNQGGHGRERYMTRADAGPSCVEASHPIHRSHTKWDMMRKKEMFGTLSNTHDDDGDGEGESRHAPEQARRPHGGRHARVHPPRPAPSQGVDTPEGGDDRQLSESDRPAVQRAANTAVTRTTGGLCSG